MKLIRIFRHYYALFCYVKKMSVFGVRVRGQVSLSGTGTIKGGELVGNVCLGNRVKLNQVKIAGTVKIGRFTSIMGPSSLHSRVNDISIGSFCSIAKGLHIQEYQHHSDRLTSYNIHQNIFKQDKDKDLYSKGGVSIGNDVWIGTGVTILSGVTIGDGAIIGAGAVLAKDVPAYEVHGGVPAKLIKRRFSEDEQVYLEQLNWYDWTEERIKENRDKFELPVCELLKR